MGAATLRASKKQDKTTIIIRELSQTKRADWALQSVEKMIKLLTLCLSNSEIELLTPKQTCPKKLCCFYTRYRPIFSFCPCLSEMDECGYERSLSLSPSLFSSISSKTSCFRVYCRLWRSWRELHLFIRAKPIEMPIDKNQFSLPDAHLILLP